MKRRRIAPSERREEIIAGAMIAAEIFGYHVMTIDQIAGMAHTSPSLIGWYFKTIANLRKVVIRRAIKDKKLLIIAQGIVNSDPTTVKIDSKLKKKAVTYALNV